MSIRDFIKKNVNHCFQISVRVSSNDCDVLDSEEHSGRDGAARLCIQYEMEMTSKRKPVSLLDALDDTTDKRGREDSMPGEERVRQQLKH